MLTFDPARDPQSDPKKSAKVFKIGVEKRYAVLTSKWTVLGVDSRLKKSAKIDLDFIWAPYGLHIGHLWTCMVSNGPHMDPIWTPCDPKNGPFWTKKDRS